jgi:hypothetical protein
VAAAISKTTVKLKEITNNDFAWAMSSIVNVSLPAKAAYWLAKSFRKIEAIQKDYEKTRMTTLKKYAVLEKAPDGKDVIKIDEKTKEAVFKETDGREKFLEELNSLQDVDVEIHQVPFELFGDDVKIETRLLLLLDKVITQPEL